MWPLFGRSCQSKARLDEKTVVITGANTGIGKETARDLYRRGARVVLACRDLAKANAAVKDIKTAPPSKPNREQFVGKPGEVVVCKLDLTSLASIRECAKHIYATESALHILVNNAGIIGSKGVTEDGFDTTFGTNHLGPFLFTLLLLPKIIQSRKDSDPCCRIINMVISTLTISCPKNRTVLYLHTVKPKANIAGVNIYSLHPGFITTELTRNLDECVFRSAGFLYGMLGPLLKTEEQGAQTTLHCAVDRNAAKESGLYYRECAVYEPSYKALDDVKAASLWEVSAKLVGFSTNNLTEIIEQISMEYLK